MLGNGLTEKQQQVLECIENLARERGYPPTVREIGEAVGLRSSSSVHAHLRSLERMGMIRRDAELTRAIRISGHSLGARAERIRVLPVVGRVAAGSPLPAFEEIEDSFPIPEEMIGGDEGFMLRVKGDSMIEDGILEGDYVVVRRQDTAVSGDTVVAMVGDEATVKKFYVEDGRVRLQPANAEIAPMYFHSVRVVGKVVGLVRRM